MLGDVAEILRSMADDLLAGSDDPFHARNTVLVAAVTSPIVELGESDEADIQDVLDILAGKGGGRHQALRPSPLLSANGLATVMVWAARGVVKKAPARVGKWRIIMHSP